jgi:hypothetical protein
MWSFRLPRTLSRASISIVGVLTLTTAANCAKILTQPVITRAASPAKTGRRRRDPAVTPGPLRVAVVTQHFPNSQQPSVGQTAYQTVRLLAERCDVHVFYPEASYPSWLTPRSAKHPPLDRDWSPPGVETTYIPYPALPLLSRPFNGFTIASRLMRHVRRFEPDVILSYTIYPDGYAAVRIAKTLGVQAILTAIG